jgi:hypothetical protein
MTGSKLDAPCTETFSLIIVLLTHKSFYLITVLKLSMSLLVE